MKPKSFGMAGIFLAGISCLLSVSSCSEETACPDADLPTVGIEMEQSDDYSSCRVRFVPSNGTEYFVYYLGESADLAGFEDSSLPGIESLTTNREQEVIFENLELKKEYTIFARAYSHDGKPGGIAMKSFFNGAKLSVSAQYVTDTSAGIVISMGDGWSSCRYHFGTESDREDFVSGKIAGNTIVEKERYVVNRFDLQPDSEYVFYTIPVNRMGVEFEPMEFRFTTCRKGECASTELELPVHDVYMMTAQLHPNGLCSKTVGICSLLSLDDTMVDMNCSTILESQYNGDIEAMLAAYEESGGGIRCL